MAETENTQDIVYGGGAFASAIRLCVSIAMESKTSRESDDAWSTVVENWLDSKGAERELIESCMKEEIESAKRRLEEIDPGSYSVFEQAYRDREYSIYEENGYGEHWSLLDAETALGVILMLKEKALK